VTRQQRQQQHAAGRQQHLGDRESPAAAQHQGLHERVDLVGTEVDQGQRQERIGD
jgi:hypothetical protein